MRNSRPKGQAQHFYPRPPRGGRPRLDIAKMRATGISIHALREEGDLCGRRGHPCRSISIHALREEGDVPVCMRLAGMKIFLSTPSARRATLPSCWKITRRQNFYPRPPRGGRHKHLERRLRASKFLSTPSARRATVVPCCLRTLLPNFYPRPPRGGRPAQLARASAAEAISIHVLREEGDRTDTYFAGMPRISIHALREEGDFLRGQSSCARANFYPRPPRGGRRCLRPVRAPRR